MEVILLWKRKRILILGTTSKNYNCLSIKTASSFEAVFCIVFYLTTNINIIFLILILNYINLQLTYLYFWN